MFYVKQEYVHLLKCTVLAKAKGLNNVKAYGLIFVCMDHTVWIMDTGSLVDKNSSSSENELKCTDEFSNQPPLIM